jgi:hypothetical protein
LTQINRGGIAAFGRIKWSDESPAAASGAILTGAAAALAQLWLRVWDPETFIKLLITDGVVLVVDRRLGRDPA